MRTPLIFSLSYDHRTDIQKSLKNLVDYDFTPEVLSFNDSVFIDYALQTELDKSTNDSALLAKLAKLQDLNVLSFSYIESDTQVIYTIHTVDHANLSKLDNTYTNEFKKAFTKEEREQIQKRMQEIEAAMKSRMTDLYSPGQSITSDQILAQLQNAPKRNPSLDNLNLGPETKIAATINNNNSSIVNTTKENTHEFHLDKIQNSINNFRTLFNLTTDQIKAKTCYKQLFNLFHYNIIEFDHGKAKFKFFGILQDITRKTGPLSEEEAKEIFYRIESLSYFFARLPNFVGGMPQVQAESIVTSPENTYLALIRASSVENAVTATYTLKTLDNKTTIHHKRYQLEFLTEMKIKITGPDNKPSIIQSPEDLTDYFYRQGLIEHSVSSSSEISRQSPNFPIFKNQELSWGEQKIEEGYRPPTPM